MDTIKESGVWVLSYQKKYNRKWETNVEVYATHASMYNAWTMLEKYNEFYKDKPSAQYRNLTKHFRAVH